MRRNSGIELTIKDMDFQSKVSGIMKEKSLRKKYNSRFENNSIFFSH
jgi:hypothetical protein